MPEKIMGPDGTEFTPISLADHLGISEKQLATLRESAMQQSLISINDAIARQAEQWSALDGELYESIEASKEDMIRRQADANAEAYAKALRSSPFLFDEIVGALAALCGNPTYNSSSSEDSMNDYVRDILGHGLQVRDQTRQGISGSSRSAEKGQAGEMDIQIRNNGRPIGIYEGLRLDSVCVKVIYEHIIKATINYNPQGVKEIFVVAYVRGQSTSFGDFWKRFMTCVKEYQAPVQEYQIVWEDEEENTGLSAVRSIHGTYDMDGADHNVHVMAVKLMK